MDLVFAALQAQGRSQRWLAAQLGIHESQLSRYKDPGRAAPAELVRRAYGILGLPYVVPSGTDMEPDGIAANPELAQVPA